MPHRVTASPGPEPTSSHPPTAVVSDRYAVPIATISRAASKRARMSPRVIRLRRPSPRSRTDQMVVESRSVSTSLVGVDGEAGRREQSHEQRPEAGDDGGDRRAGPVEDGAEADEQAHATDRGQHRAVAGGVDAHP